MKLLLALSASVLCLTACKMQQDPISGAPDSIRSGRPPQNTEKPVQAKPIPKEALQIDAPNLVNGRAGSSVVFKIKGRVLTPNVPFTILIDNPQDFPGSTFDSATGEFKWTPNKSLLGGNPSVDFALRVSLYTEATKDQPVVSMEKKTITIIVGNSYSKPIVNLVRGDSGVLTGSRIPFQFQIEDIDAFNEGDVRVDVRDCSTAFREGSVAHLIEVGSISIDPSAPNKYKGEAILDLADVENITSGAYCFGLMAVSKYGVSSDIYTKSINIEAKMKSTRITMEEGPAIPVGQKMQWAFTIYDPSGLGTVSIKSTDDISQILPGSSLKCETDWSVKSRANCVASIDTANAVVKTYRVKITAENAGDRPGNKTSTNHTIRIQVKAATP